jgi:hypothetical protein
MKYKNKANIPAMNGDVGNTLLVNAMLFIGFFLFLPTKYSDESSIFSAHAARRVLSQLGICPFSLIIMRNGSNSRQTLLIINLYHNRCKKKCRYFLTQYS